MEQTRSLLFRLEIIWLLITGLVAVIILAPILYFLPDYRFLQSNLIFIVVIITFSRYIFQLRFTFLNKWRVVKVALIFACIWITFLLIQDINAFQTFLDENGPEAVVGSLPREQQSGMMTYIRSEMLLFGVGAVISCIIVPIRLVVSIWRRWNGYEE